MRAFARLLGDTSVGRVLAELFGPGGLTPTWLRRSASTTPSPGRQLAAEAIKPRHPSGPLRGDIDPVVVDQLWGASYHRLPHFTG